jgi:hypothetical protein
MEEHTSEFLEIPIETLERTRALLSQVKYPALAEVSANFGDSVHNLQFLGILPHMLISHGYAESAGFEFFRSMTKIDDIRGNGTFESWWEQVSSRVRSVAETEEAQKKFRDHLWNTASQHIETLLKDKRVADALRSLKLARIVFGWTAFECMVADMWEIAVNEKAIELGQPTFQHLPQDSISNEGITARNVAVGILARYGFDLRNALGTVLRPKFDFTSVAGIQCAYEAAFGKSARLIEIFGDKDLIRLEVTRHVGVHRAGIVDREYIRRTDSNLRQGQLIQVDDKEVIAMLVAMMRAVCDLVALVDDRLCALTTRSSTEQHTHPA